MPRLRRFGPILALAGPLALTNLGNHLLGVVDSAVVGRFSEASLAGVGLGGAIFFGVAVIGFGAMIGLDPLISQAVGAGERGLARQILWQGLWLALVFTLPLGLLMLSALEGLEALGVEAATGQETSGYVYARLASLPFFLWLVGTRGYLQAHDTTRPLVLGVVFAHALNLPLSCLLVFGDRALLAIGLPALGLAPMGAAGAGWATAISTIVQLGVAAAALPAVEPGLRFSRRLERALLRRILAVGLPVGGTLFAEVGIFMGIGVLAVLFGTRALAAHHVALSLAATAFQVPLAIGAAASVRVGHAIGRGQSEAARRSGLTALSLASLFMFCTALLFVLWPRALSALITSEASVIALAAPLMLVAAAFQLVDGLQVVAAGALRGAGDTRYALGANLVGHYLIGLPLGAALAWPLGMGVAGLWWGLSAGLTAVAIALVRRFLQVSSRPIARV